MNMIDAIEKGRFDRARIIHNDIMMLTIKGDISYSEAAQVIAIQRQVEAMEKLGVDITEALTEAVGLIPAPVQGE